MRVEVDTGGDRMQNKIRQAQNLKVPYMLVVGDKEMEAEAVAVRLRSGENLGAVAVTDFLEQAGTVIASRSIELQP
jgi:threonyl-tRNA synthetase